MVAFPQHGACLCGDVAYRLTEDPLTVYVCHCTDCQTQSGSAFSLSMITRAEALEILRGEPREYDLHLEGGRRKRCLFCDRCSARLWGPSSSLPSLAVLEPGTLDDTSWVEPVGHIFTRSAQPWVRIPEGTLRCETQMEGDERMAFVHAWKNRTRAKES